MKDITIGLKVAVLFVLVTFLYLFGVTFSAMPTTGAEQAKTIVPFLMGTIMGTVMGFYYGNSHKDVPPAITTVDQAAIDAAKKVAEETVIKTKEDVKPI